MSTEQKKLNEAMVMRMASRGPTTSTKAALPTRKPEYQKRTSTVIDNGIRKMKVAVYADNQLIGHANNHEEADQMIDRHKKRVGH